VYFVVLCFFLSYFSLILWLMWMIIAHVSSEEETRERLSNEIRENDQDECVPSGAEGWRCRLCDHF